jgi:hypothetical protein
MSKRTKITTCEGCGTDVIGVGFCHDCNVALDRQAAADKAADRAAEAAEIKRAAASVRGFRGSCGECGERRVLVGEITTTFCDVAFCCAPCIASLQAARLPACIVCHVARVDFPEARGIRSSVCVACTDESERGGS